MDRNTIIGLTLIFVLFLVWQQFVAPSPEEIEARRRAQDSLARQEQIRDSIGELQGLETTAPAQDSPSSAPESDSLRLQRMQNAFGPFAAAAALGKEELHTLENEFIRLTFSSRGGRIVDAELKQFSKVSEDEKLDEVKSPLHLLDDKRNRFSYFLPLKGAPNGGIETGELFFESTRSDEAIVFRAAAGEGRYFEQRYEFINDYQIDYTIKLVGLGEVLSTDSGAIRLNWINYLDKLEKNTTYEKQYSTVNFKPVDARPDYCSFTSDDEEVIEAPLKWVAHTNQFFNTSLIAESSFSAGKMQVEIPTSDKSNYVKKLSSEIMIPLGEAGGDGFAMHMYIGPNEFKRLYAMGQDLQDVIPFGWSIIGTINRWVIRPVFNFLSLFIENKGLVILALTFIVKLALFPLTYRMLYSQSKMGALKPQLESLREKFKDDPQQQQMEQMKIYREFGVNPLGGCMPMLLQMPIWFALYRFFPASFEFRQEGFLWANDLSSYDAFIRLPFEIPFGFGAHISLFTMLWAVTTLMYTYYNTRHMDLSANPAMKYMQYIMPLFFLGFFNSFASGLTAYLLFSNLLNIGQTIVAKNFIIDQEKIKQELEAYRKKPKKKGGFQARLEAALKEQQRMQQDRENQDKKKRK